MFRPLLGRRLALCVSGGADSMALLHLAARWLRLESARAAWRRLEEERIAFSRSPVDVLADGPMPPDLPVVAEWMKCCRQEFAAPGTDPHWPPIVVLTVDHQLRPGSDAEAAFVKQEAESLGLPHQTLVWHDPKPTGGIQEAARAARHRLLHAVIEAEVWAWRRLGDPLFGRLDLLNLKPRRPERAGWKRALVTAHHLDDQAETFLMRLARGSSPDGLACMRQIETFWAAPTPQRSYRSYYQIVRPLLGATKAHLESVLATSGHRWREDPSNRDRHHERVRVRQALPGLAALGITPEQIGMATARLALARENSRSRVGEDARRVLVSDHGGLYAQLDCIAVAGWPFDRVMRVLRFLFAAYRGSAPAPDFAQLAMLTQELQALGTLDKQTLAGCIIAPPPPTMGLPSWHLLIWREAGRMAAEALRLAPGSYVDWDNGRFRVFALKEASGPVTVRALGEAGWKELRRRVPALSSWRLPPGAGETMPAIWDQDRLLTVPSFETLPRSLGCLKAEIEQEWQAQSGPTGSHYRVDFNGFWLGEQEAGLLYGQRE